MKETIEIIKMFTFHSQITYFHWLAENEYSSLNDQTQGFQNPIAVISIMIVKRIGFVFY